MVHWLEIENISNRNGVEVKLSFRLIRVKRFYLSDLCTFQNDLTRFELGQTRRFFLNFDDTFHVLWVVTITISIITFYSFLVLSCRWQTRDRGWIRIRREHVVPHGERIGVQNDIFKKIHERFVVSSLRNISFQYSTICHVSRPFSLKCILSEGRQLWGKQSRAAREKPPEVYDADCFSERSIREFDQRRR